MGEGYVLLYDVLISVEDPQGETHEIVFMVYDPRSSGGGTTAGTRSGTGSGPASGIDLSGLSSRAGGTQSGSGR